MDNRIYLCMALAALLFPAGLYAQNASSMMSAGGGLSTNGGGLFSFRLEQTPNGYLQYGVALEIMGYDSSDRKFSLKYPSAALTAGCFLKYRLAAARNFRLWVDAGIQAGSDNRKFIWYPCGGMEETWFVSQRLGFFTGQRVHYVFWAGAKHWQPYLMTGIKLRL